VTTDGVVVVGLGLRYVMKVDTTVGPTLKTVVNVRSVAEGWPELPCSMATHCEYQMLWTGVSRVSLGGLLASKNYGANDHDEDAVDENQADLLSVILAVRPGWALRWPCVCLAATYRTVVRLLRASLVPLFALTLAIECLNSTWSCNGGCRSWGRRGLRLSSYPGPSLGCRSLQQQA